MTKTAVKSILTPLSKQKRLIEDADVFITPPQMHFISFKAGILNVIGRMMLWGSALFFYLFGLLFDAIRGQRGRRHQAVRLRKTLEFLGGTFVKIGQQLSIRIDILPYEYCEELSKMLDRMPSFPVDYAIRRFEAVSGKRVVDVFSTIDPNPIGSASIACVFQAELKNGKRVVLKIRRPDIPKKFAADLRALDWLCLLLEGFSIIRPGFTYNLRASLKQALFEELDFYRELRYQRLFRKSAKKTKGKISAPKVYPDISGDDVLVMEFITGIFLSEIIAGYEQKNPNILTVMKNLNIDPKIVARRLLWVNHAAMVTDLFFHADPNPGNVIVLQNSKLVFIDFGSCGTFNHSQKRYLKEINYYQHQGDPEGMARASIAMMEPLPPIDVDAFAKELEALYRTSIYAMADKKADWWERTTAVQWFAFLKASMKFQVPLPSNILHMVRATLLYDTQACRLDDKTVFYKEFRRYEKFAGKIARKRLRKKIHKTLFNGANPNLYLRLEQIMDTWNRSFFRFQQFVDNKPLKFVSLLSKGAYAAAQIFKMAFLSGIVLLISVLIKVSYSWYTGEEVGIYQILNQTIHSNWYFIFIFIFVFVNLRFINFRLRDSR